MSRRHLLGWALVACLGLWVMVEWPRDGRMLDLTPTWVAARQITDPATRHLVYRSGWNRDPQAREAAEAMAVAHDLPEPPAPFVSAPWVAWAAVPWSRLPWSMARDLYLAMVAGVFLPLVATSARRVVGPEATAQALLLLLLASVPFTDGLALGQSSALVLAAWAGAALAMERGHDRLGGVICGVVASVKVAPLIVILALVVAGRRRAFVAGYVTYLGLLAVGAVMPGGIALHRAWGDVLFVLSSEVMPAWNNQSVTAVLWRGLHPGEAVFSWDLRLLSWEIWGAQRLFALAVLGALGSWVWRHRRDAAPVEVVSAGILGTVLASPLVWTHYLVWLALPQLVLVGDVRRADLRAVVLVVAVLCTHADHGWLATVADGRLAELPAFVGWALSSVGLFGTLGTLGLWLTREPSAHAVSPR